MNKQFSVGVLLSGCGFYDGSEVQETAFTLLALDKYDCESICFAPDIEQQTVVNHLTGEDLTEKRNVLRESARITRGKIKALADISLADMDALLIPGGFGVTKNLSQEGKIGQTLPEVKQIIRHMHENRKPIAAVCLSPTILVQVFEEIGIYTQLSPEQSNTPEEAKTIAEYGLHDQENRIITSPCYTNEASIAQVYMGVENTVIKLTQLCKC